MRITTRTIRVIRATKDELMAISTAVDYAIQYGKSDEIQINGSTFLAIEVEQSSERITKNI